MAGTIPLISQVCCAPSQWPPTTSEHTFASQPALSSRCDALTRGGVRGRRNRLNRIHHALCDRQLVAKLFAAVWGRQDEPQDGPGAADQHRHVAAGINVLQQGDNSTASAAHRDDATAPGAASDEATSACPDQPQSDCDSTDGSGSTSDALPERIAQRVDGHFRAGHLERALRCLSSTSSKADASSFTAPPARLRCDHEQDDKNETARDA